MNFFVTLTAQNVEKLRVERQKIQEDIERANVLLKTNLKEQSNASENIGLLQTQIKGRQQIINSYNNEIGQIKKRIESSDASIAQLEKDVAKHHKEYVLLLLELQKRKGSSDAISYMLGSDSFNQAFRRYRMLQELNSYRKNQVIVLKLSQQQLVKERAKLVELQKSLAYSLSEVQRENGLLLDKRKEHESYLASLKGKEKGLYAEIAAKRKSDEALEAKIREIIASAVKTSKVTVEGTDFGKFKGKLKWPVNQSVVVSNFGEHDHPALKGVKVKNNGIDLKTTGSNDVFVIFQGEVSRVIGIPGYNKAVIIRHGKYLSVYANLNEVVVKVGDIVKEGQILGKVFSGDADNSNTLHFEIWQENNKLNPLQWLKM